MKKSPKVEDVAVDSTKEVAEPTVEKLTASPVTAQRRWRTGSIFWGAALVVIGGLLLLDNLNIIDVRFGYLWQLWPLLIVLAGLSIMTLRGWIGGLVIGIAALGLVGVVVATAVENPYFTVTPRLEVQTQRVTQSVTSADIEKLDLTVKTGAAEVILSSSAQRNGVEATLESSHTTLSRNVYTQDGTQFVRFSTDTKRNMWFGGGFTNKLSLDLTRSVPLALHIDIGASKISGDLSEVALAGLSVKAGASDIDLRLGTKSTEQELTLDAGASSIRLSVPESAGVRVYAKQGLSNVVFDNFDKSDDGVYQSANFDTATARITIRADIGVSRLEVNRY